MTRRMLINAQRPQELRIAVVSGDTLEDYQVAIAQAGLTRGNIYRGVVASVQPSLDAAFVDYGAAKDGLLRAGDVVPQAFHRTPPEGSRRHRIDKMLERGKPILVQVTKDPSGTKGAALTTNISLAGRYLVLMPYDDVRGISRKVEDEDERRALREVVLKLAAPEGFGFIVRTNAIGQSKTALNRDLNALLRLWKRIRSEANQGKGPRLLYSDQDLIVQAVRDMLSSDVDEVLVDDDEAFERVQAAMRAFMPRSKTRLVRYREKVPLFSRYNMESQLERIFQPRVELPCGGSIVIEGTEALTAIDVNSGRSTRAGSQEETAYATNLEAVQEVARQLRLRDIGGLVVVDLIDMSQTKHRKAVEKAMREAVKADRARVSVGRISPNGLLEINRQRLKTPLVLRTHRLCPTCGGGGRIPSAETVSLTILRRIEERAATGRLKGVKVRLHPELADALQNHYRAELAALEAQHEIRIEVMATPGLHRSEEDIQWITGRLPEETAQPPEEAPAVQVTDLTTGGGPAGRPAQGERPEEAAGAPGEPPAPSGDEPAPAEEPQEGRSRRRRSRSRKKKRPAAENGSRQAAPGGNTEEPSGSGGEPEPPSSGAAAGEDGNGDAGDAPEPRKSSSRRRRRPRRRKKPAGGEESASASPEETGSTTSREADAAPEPAPRKDGSEPSRERESSGESASDGRKTEPEGDPAPAPRGLWNRLFGVD